MGVIAGDDAYGRGGAHIFADEVGSSLQIYIFMNMYCLAIRAVAITKFKPWCNKVSQNCDM